MTDHNHRVLHFAGLLWPVFFSPVFAQVSDEQATRRENQQLQELRHEAWEIHELNG